jgi:hypothetical protein
VKHIVRVCEDFEIALVGCKSRRVVDICKGQAWDSEVSKLRVRHFPAPQQACLNDERKSSLEESQNHLGGYKGR